MKTLHLNPDRATLVMRALLAEAERLEQKAWFEGSIGSQEVSERASDEAATLKWLAKKLEDQK